MSYKDLMVAWTTTSQPPIGSNSQEYVPKKGFHKWTPNNGMEKGKKNVFSVFRNYILKLY